MGYVEERISFPFERSDGGAVGADRRRNFWEIPHGSGWASLHCTLCISLWKSLAPDCRRNSVRDFVTPFFGTRAKKPSGVDDFVNDSRLLVFSTSGRSLHKLGI